MTHPSAAIATWSTRRPPEPPTRTRTFADGHECVMEPQPVPWVAVCALCGAWTHHWVAGPGMDSAS